MRTYVDRENVLILGQYARDHALAYGLSKTCNVRTMPGNAGTALLDNKLEDIDYVVPGPAEAIYEAGSHGRVWGASTDAARIETNKLFMKQLLTKYDIPTAPYWVFMDEKDVLRFLKKKLSGDYPQFVIKAVGLAGGCGVAIPCSIDDATCAVEKLSRYADAYIVEEFLSGLEFSMTVIVHRKGFNIFGTTQEYKRAFDGNLGPMTAGMGEIMPAKISEGVFGLTAQVVEKTLYALSREGIPYYGVLDVACIVIDGKPMVIEYGARFGDPDATLFIPALENNLSEVLFHGAKPILRQDRKNGVAVVIAAGGYPYPDACVQGQRIRLPRTVNDKHGDKQELFHGGTKRDDECKLVVNGGRILTCVGYGDTIADARKHVYDLVKQCYFFEMYYRTDIGLDVEAEYENSN